MNYIYSDNQSVLPSELTIYCDEAWRWPLAGPVWVWVMISHGRVDTSSFQDSKKLTSNQRVSAYQKILEYTQQWLITHAWWSATAYEIDRYGIIQAIQLATLRALAQAFKVYFLTHMRDKLLQSVWWSDHIFATLIDNLITWRNDQDVDRVRWFVATFIQEPQTLMKLNQLIRDGNHTFGLDILLWCHVKTIIQGDAKVPLIWAASIVAKVQRDAYMTAISKKYPKRWFETHKWYGTLNHRNLIHRSKRLTPEHRKSFCTNYMTTSKKVYLIIWLCIKDLIICLYSNIENMLLINQNYSFIFVVLLTSHGHFVDSSIILNCIYFDIIPIFTPNQNMIKDMQNLWSYLT